MSERRKRLDESFSGRALKKSLTGDSDVEIDYSLLSISKDGEILFPSEILQGGNLETKSQNHSKPEGMIPVNKPKQTKMVNLGDRVKDSITGFEGIAVARSECLNGCVRVEIQPDKLKNDGSPINSIWLDESRVDNISTDISARCGFGQAI